MQFKIHIEGKQTTFGMDEELAQYLVFALPASETSLPDDEWLRSAMSFMAGAVTGRALMRRQQSSICQWATEKLTNRQKPRNCSAWLASQAIQQISRPELQDPYALWLGGAQLSEIARSDVLASHIKWKEAELQRDAEAVMREFS